MIGTKGKSSNKKEARETERKAKLTQKNRRIKMNKEDPGRQHTRAKLSKGENGQDVVCIVKEVYRWV